MVCVSVYLWRLVRSMPAVSGYFWSSDGSIHRLRMGVLWVWLTSGLYVFRGIRKDVDHAEEVH